MGNELNRNPILVVDDHHDTADALTRLLRRHGYDAVVAYGGEQAIQLLGSLKPAAVVLDVMMPGTDGRAVMRHIAADPSLEDVPVVVFTADPTHETMCEMMRLGAQECLVKGTVKWSEICHRLDKQLDLND